MTKKVLSVILAIITLFSLGSVIFTVSAQSDPYAIIKDWLIANGEQYTYSMYYTEIYGHEDGVVYTELQYNIDTDTMYLNTMNRDAYGTAFLITMKKSDPNFDFSGSDSHLQFPDFEIHGSMPISEFNSETTAVPHDMIVYQYAFDTEEQALAYAASYLKLTLAQFELGCTEKGIPVTLEDFGFTNFAVTDPTIPTVPPETTTAPIENELTPAFDALANWIKSQNNLYNDQAYIYKLDCDSANHDATLSYYPDLNIIAMEFMKYSAFSDWVVINITRGYYDFFYHCAEFATAPAYEVEGSFPMADFGKGTCYLNYSDITNENIFETDRKFLEYTADYIREMLQLYYSNSVDVNSGVSLADLGFVNFSNTPTVTDPVETETSTVYETEPAVPETSAPVETDPVEPSVAQSTATDTMPTESETNATAITITTAFVPTSSEVSQGTLIVGDTDCDGKVKIKDVTTIQKFVAHIIAFREEFLSSDVNADSEVNIKDATIIQKWLANIYVEYPIGDTF